MFYVMVLTICIASPVIAHKDLCRVFHEDTPFISLEQCMTQGRMISNTLNDEGYYTSVFCNQSYAYNFGRKDATL
tara:strand:+ start:198 stop:422 length:225 start_codon:yes stop_codon:yes gene_type:complete